jgi:hypothetical protein
MMEGFADGGHGSVMLATVEVAAEGEDSGNSAEAIHFCGMVE